MRSFFPNIENGNRYCVSNVLVYKRCRWTVRVSPASDASPCLPVILIILNSKYHIVIVKPMHCYIWKTISRCSIWIFFASFCCDEIWWEFLSHLFSWTLWWSQAWKKAVASGRASDVKIITIVVYNNNNVFVKSICKSLPRRTKRFSKMWRKKLSLTYVCSMAFAFTCPSSQMVMTVLELTHDIF